MTASETPATIPAAAKPPRCAMCRARMNLARSEPGPNGSEKHTYACPKCEFTKTKTLGDPLDAGRHRPLKSRG